MNKNKIYIVLPCYNEEKNIEPLVKDWVKELETLKKPMPYEIVVVDDGSQDGTKAICDRLILEKNITVIRHIQNKGLGEVLNTGIQYVLSQKDGRYLCVMDADQSHRPQYIHDMLLKIKEQDYGCIIASRYEKGAKVEGLSRLRILTSHCAKLLYQLMFKVEGVKDYTCGYRLYDVSYLVRLQQIYGQHIVAESSFACMAELLYKLSGIGCKFSEVPFVLKYQLKEGTSKMNIVKTTKRSLAIIFKLKFS